MAELTYTATFADKDWTLDIERNAACDGWSIVRAVSTDEDGDTEVNPCEVRLPRAIREDIEGRLVEDYGLRIPYGA